MRRFQDRSDAGRELAERVAGLGLDRPIVIGIAPQGIPVAHEVARALGAPLEARVVRRLRPRVGRDLTLGAISEGEGRWIEHSMCALAGTGAAELHSIEASERALLEQLAERLGAMPRERLHGRHVVIVDEGLDSRAPVRALLDALRAHAEPARIVVATPIAGRQVLEALRTVVDDVVAVRQADALVASSAYYDDARRVSDELALQLVGARRTIAAAHRLCA